MSAEDKEEERNIEYRTEALNPDYETAADLEDLLNKRADLGWKLHTAFPIVNPKADAPRVWVVLFREKKGAKKR